MVAGHEHRRPFSTSTLAKAERADLLAYAQRGTPFHVGTGLPEPVYRQTHSCSWYAHACEYVDMKWPVAAAGSRRNIAESLVTVMPAFITDDRGRPDAELLRRALSEWAFVTPKRAAGPPPGEFAAALAWLEKHTVHVADLEEPNDGARLVRAALDALSKRLDGKSAAANTVARKRAVLVNAFNYAVELGRLNGNPVDGIAWKRPKQDDQVDRRCVVNRQQAERLLAAVEAQGEVGRRLAAFFATQYYAALRPAETINLRRKNMAALPEEGWGELLLTRSNPRGGTRWTDSGTSREERSLKHRSDETTRVVPAPPALVQRLRSHVEEFGYGHEGLLFVGPLGGLLDESSYLPAWRAARRTALTDEECASPLAARPYDLRHAAVSTWLNAGVPPAQVAEWAGHSVAVLLRVYAKCIVGQDAGARRLIDAALRDALEDS
ncbi:tyrosine-type recombinase/integrase [Embleya sp. NBC_00896]|uniref:tyrosine-type recombinase/integrase n=1 Tax=Embleya sp. NBC_00896 TaxID=2975961 RepID=UPI0038709F77|nr:tyrosine-type recombinase/integrase [Embleya sp. NBC_00896]